MTRSGDSEKPKLGVFDPGSEEETDVKGDRPYEAGDFVRYSNSVWRVNACYKLEGSWELTIVNPSTKQVLERIKAKEVNPHLGVVG